MALTKFESYYEKISEQLKALQDANEYATESIAFAHWYLEKYHRISEQQIAEAIIDGSGDLGIDTIIIDEANEVLTVMQFKYPSKRENINSEISQSDILKTWNGFETLITNERDYNGDNKKFQEFKDQLRNITITQFHLLFVSYNKGIVAKENKGVIEAYAEQFRKNTGSELDIIYHDRDAIANIFERLNRKNNLRIALKYKQMQSAYNVQQRKIESFVGFVSGSDAVKAVSDCIATVFDENIRLFDANSTVNSGISPTATSSDQADMFYFYNNGIVFICDTAKNSPASNEIVLEGASVVNGCQTLNVLYNATQGGRLNESVCVLVRIIQISDYSERMRITECLNSQTPIRDSYFIANHPNVRDLQEELLSHGFFLERQVNEYAYKNLRGEQINTTNVIQLEDSIQYFVGYWDNKNASLAKRNKNALFDKGRIEEILTSVSAAKVVESISTYQNICEVLTLYRKTRRNPTKQEFATYLGKTQEWLLQHIDEFRFMNTADILLMNSYANLKRKYNELGISDVSEKDLIIESIFIVRDISSEEAKNAGDINTAAFTKSAAIFGKAQTAIDSLLSRYTIPIQ